MPPRSITMLVALLLAMLLLSGCGGKRLDIKSDSGITIARISEKALSGSLHLNLHNPSKGDRHLTGLAYSIRLPDDTEIAEGEQEVEAIIPPKDSKSLDIPIDVAISGNEERLREYLKKGEGHLKIDVSPQFKSRPVKQFKVTFEDTLIFKFLDNLQIDLATGKLKVDVNEIEIRDVEYDKVLLWIRLKITNPLFFPLIVDDLSADISTGGLPIGHARFKNGLDLAPDATSLELLEAPIDMEGITNLAKAFDFGFAEEIPITISVTSEIDLAGVRYVATSDLKGTMKRQYIAEAIWNAMKNMAAQVTD